MQNQPIDINDKFAEALELINAGEKNLFVTGRAGTGKSTLLTYFRKTTGRDVVVLAPTGVAAVNVGGQTIHSFFRFRPDITVEKAKRAAKKAVNQNRADVYREIETLIIDEISMVRADLFDCADAFLRIARDERSKPFGGVPVVMIGDLYQLPPVVRSDERVIFNSHYKSPYFFDSKSYSGMNIKLIELEKVYRQHDDKFIKLLNAVRNNTLDYEGIEAFNSRLVDEEPSFDGGYIHLTSLNREANTINDKKLSELSGKPRKFHAEVSGKFDAKSYPADELLALKKGAQVMLLNNDSNGRWVNGTIGNIVSMNENSVRVRIQDGGVENIGPHTWQMFRFGVDSKTKKIVSESVGKFTQLPMMLAWAVTIHKSQGKTFDRAVIDVGRVFEAGQAYVALSRLRTLEGMFLAKPLKKGHVRVDWRVVKFLTSHRYAISEREMPLNAKVAMIEDAIETGQKIEITYLKTSDVKSKHVIEPFEIGEMEYNGYPFLGLRATCSIRNDERIFRVDRILEMRRVEWGWGWG